MVVNFSARRHAGGHHQLGHGVGDADQGVAAAGGPALARPRERPRRGALVRMKRRAVYGVDDGRGVQAPGGRPAEDAALGAMGMDDVGVEIAPAAA